MTDVHEYNRTDSESEKMKPQRLINEKLSLVFTEKLSPYKKSITEKLSRYKKALRIQGASSLKIIIQDGYLETI